MNSLFTFTYNCISQGYPFIESIYNLLPLADEIIIVDCGSTDGTKELLESLSLNPNIHIYHDSWEMGKGGRNFSGTAAKCRSLCQHDTIIFAEADEVWEEGLVNTTRIELEAGNNNLAFRRFQLTQNFNRCFWYPEKEQLANRVFSRNSEIMRNVEAGDSLIQSKTQEPFRSVSPGYIIDCRNNFRDSYILREETSKRIWGDTSRNTIRFTPAHTGYKYELTNDEFSKELQDERWLWNDTIFNIPEIMKYHLGKPKYEVRPELVNEIRNWRRI